MSRSVYAMDNARVGGHDPMKQPRTGPRRSVVVPVYNEVGTIAEAVRVGTGRESYNALWGRHDTCSLHIGLQACLATGT